MDKAFVNDWLALPASHHSLAIEELEYSMQLPHEFASSKTIQTKHQ
jgi:hypothetical protein